MVKKKTTIEKKIQKKIENKFEGRGKARHNNVGNGGCI